MSLATLLLLADTRFPTGAHAHSMGMEAAVGLGLVKTLGDVETYIRGRLITSASTEASFAAAANSGRFALAQLDREFAARTPSPRARTVSRTLGRQLERATRNTWPEMADLRTIHPDGPMQPIALGSIARSAGLSHYETALCSLHHAVGAATTAAVRLMGCDPFAANDIASRLCNNLEQVATCAMRAAEVDACSHLPANTSLLADAMMENHSKWEVRLFGS